VAEKYRLFPNTDIKDEVQILFHSNP